MGIGLAMTEGRVLDGTQTGKMLNRNWHDYKLPTALDVPGRWGDLAAALQGRYRRGADGDLSSMMLCKVVSRPSIVTYRRQSVRHQAAREMREDPSKPTCNGPVSLNGVLTGQSVQGFFEHYGTHEPRLLT